MKHKHYYRGWKTIEVPTGKWLVKSEVSKVDLDNHGVIEYDSSLPRELTRPAVITVCRGCGDMKVKTLKLLDSKSKGEK